MGVEEENLAYLGTGSVSSNSSEDIPLDKAADKIISECQGSEPQAATPLVQTVCVTPAPESLDCRIVNEENFPALKISLTSPGRCGRSVASGVDELGFQPRCLLTGAQVLLFELFGGWWFSFVMGCFAPRELNDGRGCETLKFIDSLYAIPRIGDVSWMGSKSDFLSSQITDWLIMNFPMGDTENPLPPSKKRAAGGELSRDNPGLDDEEEAFEHDVGTFKSAGNEVLASRKIVKIPTTEVKGDKVDSEVIGGKNDVNKETDGTKYDNDNKQTECKGDEAGGKSITDEKKLDMVNEESKPELPDVNKESGDNRDTECDTAKNKGKKDSGNENIEKVAEAVFLSSFQQLSSSQNAFTGFSGTGFPNSTFSFGSIPKDGSPTASGSGSLFGLKTDQPSYPSFGFSLSNNENSSVFGPRGPGATKSEGSGFPSMQEVAVETGEENEMIAFTADSVLFEFAEGGWKERGKGELKVNVSTAEMGKSRLVMRARGNYRLILNVSLYPDMKLTNMEKRGVTFACMNSTGEAKDRLSTFALKFKDSSLVEEFGAAVTEHKGKTAVVLKTPENSPNASDD
ncbi:hypothetical protein U1Q18_044863 [Sarracenia purpurea var. burkii]